LAEATPSSRGFRWFTRNHWVPWLIHKAKTELKTQVQQHRTSLTGVRRHRPETSKRRTRVGIARLASKLSKFAVTRHPSNSAMTKFPKGPSGACILLFGLRSSFVFWLPPYNQSGERIIAISWNPSSFCFAIFLFLFPLKFLRLA
jgi:hypothetical protein